MTFSYSYWFDRYIDYYAITEVMLYETPMLDKVTKIEAIGRVPNPVTMGQEIEQFDEWLDPYLIDKIISELEGHYDASGPIEWNYGPFVYPPQWLKRLYNDVEYPKYIWYWRHQDRNGAGCGSHIHFRPHPRYLNTPDEYDYWAILWNTLNDVAPLLYPLITLPPYTRDESHFWAEYRYIRYSPEKMRDLVENNVGRTYTFLTINPAKSFVTNKPLTIELRASDGHPVLLSTFQRLMMVILRDAFRYKESPKVADYLVIENIVKSIQKGENIYEVFKESGPIVFIRPIKYLRLREFKNAMHFFRTLIYWFIRYNYTTKELCTDYLTRVLWFVYNEGDYFEEPWENFWYAFMEKEFEWETVPKFTGYWPKPTEMGD